MPKKEKDFVKELQTAQQQRNFKPSQIKKSRSAEDLKSKSPISPEIKELQAQITALLEQITRIKQEANQSIKFESQKAQNYLEQITKLTAEVDIKEQTIRQLTANQNKLTDQNNELRLNKLKTSDQLGESWKKEDKYFNKYQQESKLTQQLKLQVAKLQKDLTITQQDLKSAQRVIELRLNKPDNNQESPFDYWPLIRIGLLTLLTYLLLNNLQKQENYHGKLRN